MYSIYFNNRCLAVCSHDDIKINDPETVLYIPSQGDSSIKNLPFQFQESPSIQKLYIPTDRPEVLFSELCSGMTRIVAGGGLVTNKKGYYMLIFRHGVWDLPKGKQEPDEEIERTAIREVQEECGIREVVIQSFICTTYHSYMLGNTLVIKHTHWYRMDYLGNGETTSPQKEEDIERAIWVKPEDLHLYLEKSYPSIKGVFAKVK